MQYGYVQRGTNEVFLVFVCVFIFGLISFSMGIHNVSASSAAQSITATPTKPPEIVTATIATPTPCIPECPTVTPVSTVGAVPTSSFTAAPTATVCGSMQSPCVTKVLLPVVDERSGAAIFGTLLCFGLLYAFIRDASRIVLTIVFVISVLLNVISGDVTWIFGWWVFLLCITVITQLLRLVPAKGDGAL